MSYKLFYKYSQSRVFGQTLEHLSQISVVLEEEYHISLPEK